MKKTTHKKKKQTYKKPISANLFLRNFVVKPSIVLLLVGLILVLIGVSSDSTDYAAFQWAVFVVLFGSGVISVVAGAYSIRTLRRHKKLRNQWQYYIFSVIVPALVLGYLLIGLAIPYVIKINNPDYQRYVANLQTCKNLYLSSVELAPLVNSEVFSKDIINKTGIDTKSLNARHNEVVKYGLIANGTDNGDCNTRDSFGGYKVMSEEQATRVQQMEDKKIETRKDMVKFRSEYYLLTPSTTD